MIWPQIYVIMLFAASAALTFNRTLHFLIRRDFYATGVRLGQLSFLSLNLFVVYYGGFFNNIIG